MVVSEAFMSTLLKLSVVLDVMRMLKAPTRALHLA